LKVKSKKVCPQLHEIIQQTGIIDFSKLRKLATDSNFHKSSQAFSMPTVRSRKLKISPQLSEKLGKQAEAGYVNFIHRISLRVSMAFFFLDMMPCR